MRTTRNLRRDEAKALSTRGRGALLGFWLCVFSFFSVEHEAPAVRCQAERGSMVVQAALVAAAAAVGELGCGHRDLKMIAAFLAPHFGLYCVPV